MKTTFTFTGNKYIVVGDIHGDFDTFMKFLYTVPGYTIKKGVMNVTDPENYHKIILCGDYLDKGTFAGIERTINFIHANKQHFVLCMGNHEYWCMEVVKGHIKMHEAVLEQMSTWFKTAALLFQNKPLCEKFFELLEDTYHCILTPDADITHAPCKKEYIGKDDNESMKHQRNLRYPKVLETTTQDEYFAIREEFFQFLVDEANEADRFHIFGHTMVSEVFYYKNKLCIDTGSVCGNKLSTVWFDNGAMTIKSFDSAMPKKDTLYPYFRTEPKPTQIV